MNALSYRAVSDNLGLPKISHVCTSADVKVVRPHPPFDDP